MTGPHERFLEECKREIAEDADYNKERLMQRLAHRTVHCIDSNIFSPRDEVTKLITTRLNVLKHVITCPNTSKQV